jgi:opine dehydrogenase
VTKVTVVGGGNTAFGFAAALTLRDVEVALLEAPEFAASVEPVIQQGGIHIRGVAGEGFATIDMVTTDAGEAVAGASIVLVCVPAYGHQRMADLIVPYLSPDQIVVLTPGNCGGALEFAQLIQKKGTGQSSIVAEASSCLFACKKDGPGGVWIRGIKHGLPVAAFPGKHTQHVVRALRTLFPHFEPARHVLETSLSNINHIFHPPGALLNLGLVELAQQDWRFFSEGLSPAVCRVMEAVDQERVQIVAALGLEPTSTLEWMLTFYGGQGLKGRTLFEAASTSPIHGAAKGPRSLDHRYFTEDIPFGLVPIASIGRELGIGTGAIDTVVDLASLVSARDWWAEGRTAEKMGLTGMTAQQMIRYVTEGTV